MRIGKSSPSSSGSAAVPSSGITAENYVGRAGAFAAARGAGFIIRAIEGIDGAAAKNERATEPQWIAWIEYFQSKRIPCAFLTQRGMGTVPSEWPEEFDLECPSSDRRRLLPRRQRIGPRAMVDFRRLMASIGAPIARAAE